MHKSSIPTLTETTACTGLITCMPQITYTPPFICSKRLIPHPILPLILLATFPKSLTFPEGFRILCGSLNVVLGVGSIEIGKDVTC